MAFYLEKKTKKTLWENTHLSHLVFIPRTRLICVYPFFAIVLQFQRVFSIRPLSHIKRLVLYCFLLPFGVYSLKDLDTYFSNVLMLII